jgi:hypothetical protein
MLPVAEHAPGLPPVQVVDEPGQSLSVMQPLQSPERHLVLPPQSESLLHVFEQLPFEPPEHTSDFPQSLES